MHVMTVGLDYTMLGDPHGNTVQRHMEYAQRIGRLSVVTYNPIAQRKMPLRVADNFTVYPVNTRPVLFPWNAFRVASRLIRQDPPDVITTQDPFASGLIGVLLKWRFGIPLDMQNHSSFFNNHDWIAERPLRNRFLHSLGKLLVRFADTHRVLTEGEKRHYLTMGIPAERVTVLNTPTDVGLFANPVPEAEIAALRARLDLAPDAPVVVWVGLPVTFKHVELLLDAFTEVQRALPAARLVLVGNFDKRPDLVRSADPAVVRFAGRVSHDDLPPYYALADVYAHASRYEGFGKVIVEALAAGTPVVATLNDGSADIIRDGETGLLCDHTPAAFSAAILSLLRDPARARALGSAGQADVLARFDYARQLDAVAATYRKTASVGRQ